MNGISSQRLSSMNTRRTLDELAEIKMRNEFERIDAIEFARQKKTKLAADNYKNEISERRQKARTLIEKQ